MQLEALSHPPRMLREMSLATHADVCRIAEIHMAAFGTNAMLRAQFPSPAVREALQTSIKEKALVDIDDPKTTVLVVKEYQDQDEENFKVIAFAKWAHPVYEGEDYVEPPWVWPEGTNHVILEAWTNKMEEAQENSLQRNPCYRLMFIGTDPSYERRGAGSLMVRWGIEQCKSEHTPLYLESTLEAVPFYKKHGFTAQETLSLQLVVDGTDQSEIYEEIVFIYEPRS